MPNFKSHDGVELYYEESGSGSPIVFVHEFAGDYRTWEPQMRYFSRGFRCITFSARGYPPSEIPDDPEKYGQDIARADVIALMDHLDIQIAHLVGHSMGAYTALHVGIHHPQRCLSIAATGCGWGSNPAEHDSSVKLCEDIARMFNEEPIDVAAEKYAHFAMRLTFKAKDPRGFAEFKTWLREHSGTGSALTMLNLQLKRPTLWEMEAGLRSLTVPLLVIVGDEDLPCVDGSLFLKRTVPDSALFVVPRAGHTITSEEPAAVNAALAELFQAAGAGTWKLRRASA
ncbi:alpha/beta hydrolase [Paraburkholderia sp. 22B1P]|uniref:alpha/beta fold hydrolase n=1 Tax=Paraburkholderia sp. 22B1P TaxID=3080498 RepID=UPI00308D35D6|nr:alpha/beta hydrolase [Paraburkholderia sp. 22B1P]